MASTNSNMLLDNDTSCITNFLIIVIVILITYNIMTVVNFNTHQQNGYDDDIDEYGMYEGFTDSIPVGCDPSVNYSNSTNSSCRMWYIQNVLHLDLFTDYIPQDHVIDTLFPLGKIELPIYSKIFKKKPECLNDKTMAIRTSKYMVQSVDKLRTVINNTFTQLNSTMEITQNSFDPYMLSAITENTLLNVLFGIYEQIVNVFFSNIVVNNNNSETTHLTLLYLMPFMMYLKTQMSRLMESLQIILTTLNTNPMIKVNTLDPVIFVKLKNRMDNQTTFINSEVAINNLTQTLSNNKDLPIDFNKYRSIIFGAFIDTLQKCYSQIQNIQSNETENISTQHIIQGDLIHVFYRVFMYFVSVLQIMKSSPNTLPEDNTFVVKYYESAARKIITNSQPISAYHQQIEPPSTVNIDQALKSFDSIESLRTALVNISLSIDAKMLNELAKYSTPGNIGTLFMQLINSKSEILAMNIMRAQNFILDYMEKLSDEYLTSLIPNLIPKVEKFNNVLGYNLKANDVNSKWFLVGKCFNTCIREGKKCAIHNSPKCEMFGSNFNSGTLTASSMNSSSYNTNGVYVTDENGNIVLDSNGNEILSSTYSKHDSSLSSDYNTTGVYVTDSRGNYVTDKNGNNLKSQDYMNSIAYVPALDAPYPKLQSQLGKAAYDIRGIPDTPLSYAPVSGLPGRPVV